MYRPRLAPIIFPLFSNWWTSLELLFLLIQGQKQRRSAVVVPWNGNSKLIVEPFRASAFNLLFCYNEAGVKYYCVCSSNGFAGKDLLLCCEENSVSMPWRCLMRLCAGSGRILFLLFRLYCLSCTRCSTCYCAISYFARFYFFVRIHVFVKQEFIHSRWYKLSFDIIDIFWKKK